MEQHEVTIEELVNGLMDHLKLIGYKESTRERYLAYYKVFIKYCRKKEIDYFSLDLGKQFLLEHHKHKWVVTYGCCTNFNCTVKSARKNDFQKT